ncbi:MAG: tRNA (adenosine(37)-N6)-dimethylallyltransferase MiaA [Acidobacteria bacterium]|nr:tRNA (adenosine(37)-N6)-dimethylallyltransferase MiaA [Acidobacteriota bacterium]MBI3664029.1 tRNA (adenosine(37)-N6)-dimethylallyltransferase MiaA [Acidobacteriota bacterium]
MTSPEPHAFPLVAIVGPTGAGKSVLGIAVAERFGGEVVCCDSTQVYRHFDIGTAKAPPTEQSGIPHHLVDLLDAGEVFTAGEYRLRALAVLDDLRRRGKLPVFTVGTGLYLRALLEGLSDAPTRSDELRERLRRLAETHGHEYLHRILARLDPAAAARIAPRDLTKMIRALEVRLLTGKPITELHRAGRPQLEGYHAIKVGLKPPRAALYQRIERRVDAMFAAGWLEEVKRLMSAGIPADSKPFQFIGYGELQKHLAGVIALDAAVAAIRQATRRYAKRQLTWFRKETGVRWFEGFGDDEVVAAGVAEYLGEQLRLASWPRGPRLEGV